MTPLLLETLPSPIGPLTVVCDEAAVLRVISFDGEAEYLPKTLLRFVGKYSLKNNRLPTHIREAIEAFFNGDVNAIDGLPVNTGGTIFQRCVWEMLRTIPAGETTTYGELAKRLGKPSAMRAVGLANGANPIPIVLPCHRVIGASGKLTGYGGGLWRKEWLLKHEAEARQQQLQIPFNTITLSS